MGKHGNMTGNIVRFSKASDPCASISLQPFIASFIYKSFPPDSLLAEVDLKIVSPYPWRQI